MSKKSIRFIVIAGTLAFVPSVASAFHGKLLDCNPTDGVKSVVELSPGLQCATVKNKVKTDTYDDVSKAANYDGCVANPAAPWTDWAALGYGSKITAADAALVSKLGLSVKATAYGTCNFSGSANSAPASASGKFALFAADGLTKVKGGKGAIFGTVGGDLVTQSADIQGIVTKGFGVGADVRVLVGIDLGGLSDCGGGPGSCNGNILACNLGAVCPPDIAPSYLLDLITTPTSGAYIAVTDNADCTGAGTPYPCCTGAGTGIC